MQSNHNPFEEITTKLDSIERQIRDLNVQPIPVEPLKPVDRLLSVQEAAGFLRLTTPTIYSKVSKGELPVMKQGNRLYFSQNELIDYLEAGKKRSCAEIATEAQNYLEGRKEACHEK